MSTAQPVNKANVMKKTGTTLTFHLQNYILYVPNRSTINVHADY